MGEGEHWVRGMPWRLMGFGAAFIAALFAWRHGQGEAQALVRVPLVRVDGAQVAIAPPVGAPPAEVAARRAPPEREGGDEGLDIALEAQNEELSTREETTIIGGAPEAPQRLVVIMHERAPAPAPVNHQRAVGLPISYPLPHRPPRRVVGGPRPSGLMPRSATLPRRPPSGVTRGPSRPRGGGRPMPGITRRARTRRSPR